MKASKGEPTLPQVPTLATVVLHTSSCATQVVYLRGWFSGSAVEEARSSQGLSTNSSRMAGI